MEVSGLIKTISQAFPLGLESAQLYINSDRNFETYLSNSKSLLQKKIPNTNETCAAKNLSFWIKSDYFLLLCTEYVKNVTFADKDVIQCTMQQGLTFEEKKAITKCSTLKIDFSANFHLTHDFLLTRLKIFFFINAMIFAFIIP